MLRALIISSTLSEAEEFHQLLSEGKYDNISFCYPSNLTRTERSLWSLYEESRDILNEKRVDAVLALRPAYSVVVAALVHDFPNFLGPSSHSVFLCVHRYYSREYVTQGFNGNYFGARFRDCDSQAIGEAVDHVGLPSLLRDSFDLSSTPVRKLKSSKMFAREILSMERHLEYSFSKARKFLKKYLNTEKYSLMSTPSLIVEEDLGTSKYKCTLHHVEACIFEGVLLPWVIADVHSFKQKPKFTMTYTCLPTKLTALTQHYIWGTMREISQKLIDAGFNNHFFHAKLALCGSETDVKFIDLKPCLNTDLCRLYRYVFMDGDNVRAGIEVGLGQKPWIPKPKPAHYALQADFSTQLSGVSIKDIVNIKAAKSADNVELLFSEEQLMQNGCSQQGEPIVRIRSFGKSYEECHNSIKLLCSEVLKRGHKDTEVKSSNNNDNQHCIQGDRLPITSGEGNGEPTRVLSALQTTNLSQNREDLLRADDITSKKYPRSPTKSALRLTPSASGRESKASLRTAFVETPVVLSSGKSTPIKENFNSSPTQSIEMSKPTGAEVEENIFEEDISKHSST